MSNKNLTKLKIFTNYANQSSSYMERKFIEETWVILFHLYRQADISGKSYFLQTPNLRAGAAMNFLVSIFPLLLPGVLLKKVKRKMFLRDFFNSEKPCSAAAANSDTDLFMQVPVYHLNADFDYRRMLDYTRLDPDCVHTVGPPRTMPEQVVSPRNWALLHPKKGPRV